MSFLMRLTATGAAKIAAANAGGDDVALTQMAAGDGSGSAVPAPTGAETDLVNEVWRGNLSSLSVSMADPTIMLAEAVIPIAAGPFTVREIGIFDADGDLFAYGNFPETFKPSLAQGAAREMLIRASIRVASTENVTILIDASAVFATQAWCNGRFLQINANLGDVANPAAARTNIGAAPLNSPAFTGNPTAPTPAVGDNDTSIATTAFVQAVAAVLNSAIALRAPINNPIFTGDPRAPTPAAGDNDTSIATTAFVQAAVTAGINAVIAAAPGALDTLDELAAALGDDPNFATTITNLIALRAPINNPVFTGDPRAPTPAAGDNDTSIATTAFVQAAIIALIGGAPGNLNTLGELATAIGNDADFVNTVAGALALRAPINNPVFTGDPRAPTPAAGDNDTSIATTAFVQNVAQEILSGLAPNQIGSTINLAGQSAVTITGLLGTVFNHLYLEFDSLASATPGNSGNPVFEMRTTGGSWVTIPFEDAAPTSGAITVPFFRLNAGVTHAGLHEGDPTNVAGREPRGWRIPGGVAEVRLVNDRAWTTGTIRAWGAR